MQGVVGDIHIFLCRNIFQVADNILHPDAVEIVGLAAGQDGGENLVLLCGGKDEDGILRRFLKCLEKGVEGGLGQHVDLIYDIDAVAANLRRNAHLVGEGTDVLHRVVAGGIQLMDAVGIAFGKGTARLALAARLLVGPRVGAVDGLCKYAGATGLAHAARPAEKVCVRQLPAQDGILECAGYILLPDQLVKGGRPVFSCRYYELSHI